MATKGLGKGLGALFGELPDEKTEEQPGLDIPIQKIEPNPDQPRKHFDEEELQTLSDSIAQHGVIQPLAVRPLGNGFYQIVAGERRWRAARLAGLDKIPAVIVQADDRAAAELALIENLQRQDLDPIEEAQGYRRLLEVHHLTQEQIAEQVGKSRPAIANALRLLALPEEIQEELAVGTLSPGHARAVLSLPRELQRDAVQQILGRELSVRQAEALCKTMLKEDRKETPGPASPPPLQVDYIAECEKTLASRLGRGVKIVNGKRKGRLELEFYGADDLQALLERLKLELR